MQQNDFENELFDSFHTISPSFLQQQQQSYLINNEGKRKQWQIITYRFPMKRPLDALSLYCLQCWCSMQAYL